MRIRWVLVIGSALGAFGLVSPPANAAVEVPNSINAPPAGPGTERPEAAQPRLGRVREGQDAAIQLGSGFTDTYGFGIGGRYGYTFRNGIYVGAAGTWYFGNSVTTETAKETAHAAFIGGEAGYKFFVQPEWEVRPYVFLGPAFIKEVNDNPFRTESRTRFAIQPGVLGAYHFGQAFLTAEARLHATPSPTAFTLLGGAGLSF